MKYGKIRRIIAKYRYKSKSLHKMTQNTINTAKYYKLMRNTANYCKELLHAAIKSKNFCTVCSKMMQNIINCEIQQNTAKYCEFTAKELLHAAI